MFDRVNAILETLSEDACNPVTETDADSDVVLGTDSNFHSGLGSFAAQTGHQTLKMAVCTRWNSALMMIESILDLHSAITEALKKIGNYELCLNADDISVLNELRTFLSNFKPLTLLVSECNPNLTLLPLLRKRVMKACEQLFDEFRQCADSPSIIKLKIMVKNAIDKRIKISQLVNLSCCFDPAVRDAVLTSEVCIKLLQDGYNNLI